MTTKSDWEFRRDYLRDAANGLDKRAEALMTEATRYRGLADMAAIQAELPSATQVAEAA